MKTLTKEAMMKDWWKIVTQSSKLFWAWKWTKTHWLNLPLWRWISLSQLSLMQIQKSRVGSDPNEQRIQVKLKLQIRWTWWGNADKTRRHKSSERCNRQFRSVHWVRHASVQINGTKENRVFSWLLQSSSISGIENLEHFLLRIKW